MNILKTLFPFLAIIGCTTYAQEFEANVQLRPRFEYRNGYKSLLKDGDIPASFISQRSRLNLNFTQDKLKLKLALQNISVWGDVATTSTAAKNGVAVFEAWAEYSFTDKWSSRIGRQVLNYDNQRIMGGIDWIQQGQSHDAVLLTYKDTKNQLDLGVAHNANAENLLAPTTAYTTNYKNMHYAWYHTKISTINASFLFLNTGYEFAATPTELKVDYKQTYGTYLTYKGKKLDFDFGLYGQSGKSAGNDITAFYAGSNIGYALTENFKATLGYEFLSGKDQDDTSTKLKSFIPLFGTNHAFNGFMDYFYVGNHSNNVGLQDAYLKLEFPIKKVKLSVTPHFFYAHSKVIVSTVEQDSYLGTELDLTAAYKVSKDILVVGGYSQMFGTTTLEALKGGDSSKTNNWAWLMININPNIFSTKKQ
ncbi:Alginate export [Flavobacterium gillisiae]|uniref:Alginate export n=1 Tax=Flavobacterium gillisiae TaxID=150146 RepID=A0A1H4D280_9FLAO|nr:alginate export family protein [Flavobacterium gillisiae]SEA66646.1 Alginate export [Flavobacterium gillisiae]